MRKMVKRLLARLTPANRNAVILMYHQVTKRTTDPWALAVSPERFDRQLEYVKQKYHVVPFQELARHSNRKDYRKPLLAITFDDGFKDNFSTAYPILDHHKLAATFFISTGLVGTSRNYWWDELERLIFDATSLPAKFIINNGGNDLTFQCIGDRELTDEIRTQLHSWTYADGPINGRVQLFVQLWQYMQPLRSTEQDIILNSLRQQMGGVASGLAEYCTMSEDEIRAMSANPLIEIGAHTVTHPMLARQDVICQEKEIKESKSVLEKWTNGKIRSFAYPYGNYDTTTEEIVRASGFDQAVSTVETTVMDKSNQFSLPRIQVKNWDVAAMEKLLNKN